MNSFYFTFFFFFFTINTANAEQQIGTHQTGEVTQIEISPGEFRFKGVKPLDSPVVMLLENDEVNLSAVIQKLERAKQSHYNSVFDLEDSYRKIREDINTLCQNSKKEELCINNAHIKLQEAVEKIKTELSQNIVYPEYYVSLEEGLYGDRLIDKAISSLDPNCINGCSNRQITRLVIEASQEIYPQLYDRLKNKDKICLREVLNNVLKELEFQRFPKKCLQIKNKNHPVCESMSKDIDVIRGRVSEIARLSYGASTLQTTEAKMLCVDCASKVNSTDDPIDGLNNFINKIQEYGQCYELKPDEGKTVFPGTGLDRAYNLKRELDGTYSISLNLKFSADDDYDGDTPRDRVPSYYMNKVKKCIRRANTKMLGPNGKQLKIVIKEPEKQTASNCQDNTIIKVGSKEHRSNSRKYEANIDCPTITHEILHLLGLCDEYKESIRGYYVDPKIGAVESRILISMEDDEKLMNDERYEFKLAFDCRATPKTKSIMSDHEEKWDQVFEQGESDSLLNPGQFKAILYGSCEEKNKVFNECAQLAYRSSVNTSPTDCIERKLQCERQNFLGENKQEAMDKILQQISESEDYKGYFLPHLQKVQKEGETYPGELKFYKLAVEHEEQRLLFLREELETVRAWP